MQANILDQYNLSLVIFVIFFISCTIFRVKRMQRGKLLFNDIHSQEYQSLMQQQFVYGQHQNQEDPLSFRSQTKLEEPLILKEKKLKYQDKCSNPIRENQTSDDYDDYDNFSPLLPIQRKKSSQDSLRQASRDLHQNFHGIQLKQNIQMMKIHNNPGERTPSPRAGVSIQSDPRPASQNNRVDEDHDSIFGYENQSQAILKARYQPLKDKAFMKIKVGSGSFPDGKLSL